MRSTWHIALAAGVLLVACFSVGAEPPDVITDRKVYPEPELPKLPSDYSVCCQSRDDIL